MITDFVPQDKPRVGYRRPGASGGPEGRQRVAHGVRRCEEIGERQKYALAVILSEAKNLARSSFAISHFHRQSEILRFAQDDRLADSFIPSCAVGYSLSALRACTDRHSDFHCHLSRYWVRAYGAENLALPLRVNSAKSLS